MKSYIKDDSIVFDGVDNLNIGTEIELSYNFGTGKGFFVRPCLGTKWVF